MIETAINLDIPSEKPVEAARTNSQAADEMTIEKGETDTKSNSPPPKVSPKKSPKSPKSAKSSPKSPRSLSTSSTGSDLDGGQAPKPETEPVNHSNPKSLNQNQSTLLLPSGQIKSGQLFGPFTDPIQWLTIRHSGGQHGLPKEIGSLEPDLLKLFRCIQMANSADEQNLEIVVKNNKFYFRAMQAIDLDAEVRRQSDDQPDREKESSEDGGAVEQDSVKSDKRRGGKTEQLDDQNESLKESPLFAWFSSELSARLPTPAVNVINGNQRYYCTKCNSVFSFPNPTILHILFACNSPTHASGQSTTTLTSAANERSASSGGRLENNESSENSSTAHHSSSLNSSTSHHSSSLNSSAVGGSSNKTSVPSASPTSGQTSTSPLGSASEPLSYTPLNGSVSLANSKILKNLEAKLCKQFNSTISNESGTSSSTTTNQQSSTATNQQSSTGRASSGTSKSSKPTKKRAFDIDSLVNNVEQTTTKKPRASAQHVDPPEKKSAKSEKVFKTPLSTPSSKANADHLTNSTLINSLNSPLANAANGLSSSFLNPFSFLDPTSLAAGLPSAFHKVENLASSVNSPSMNSTINKSLLNNNSLADQNSLLNAAAMFGNMPNFANPFDLAAIYAQQQRNLLQSMFGQSAQSSSTSQLASSSAVGSPSAASLNYLQSQLSNPLFASQSLASLGGLNSLGGFNGLNSLLASQPSSSGAGGSLTSGMSAGLQNSLANSLFAGLSGASASSLAGFNPMASSSGAGSNLPQVPNFNHPSGLPSSLLDPFAVPQSMPAEKSSSSSVAKKSKKIKEPSSSPTNSLKSGSHQTNQQQLNNSNRSMNPSLSSLSNSLSSSLSSSLSNSLSSSLSSLLPPNDSSSGKLNSLLHPSYFQFLSPSLAALSSPQSNWCAKCNISFRMTSDLVYHMRSQHKDSAANGSSESSSPTKRKRDENKLFCQICGEGFKERHHLTRHMISH